MATTPLKTATRALSIATVLVAGFATWLLSTQKLPARGSLAPSTTTPRNVSFAVVTEAVPADGSKTIHSSPHPQLDAEIARTKTVEPPNDDESEVPTP